MSVSNIGGLMAEVPFEHVIYNIGSGIAKAQVALDANSIQIAKMMAGSNPNDRVLFAGTERSLLELGFTPTFYQFSETNIDIKVTFNLSYDRESSYKSETEKELTEKHKVNTWWGSFTRSKGIGTRTVTYETTTKYGMSAEAVSTVSTKLVPVPPPPILEELIRDVLFTSRDKAGLFVDPTQVPSVKGSSFSEAADFLRRAGYQVADFDSADGVHYVWSTSPKAYSPYDGATGITLEAKVPNVVGMTLSEGTALLQRFGLKVAAQVTDVSGDSKITASTPDAGQDYPAGTVSLTV